MVTDRGPSASQQIILLKFGFVYNVLNYKVTVKSRGIFLLINILNSESKYVNFEYDQIHLNLRRKKKMYTDFGFLNNPRRKWQCRFWSNTQSNVLVQSYHHDCLIFDS